jgi:hypothetical protein
MANAETKATADVTVIDVSNLIRLAVGEVLNIFLCAYSKFRLFLQNVRFSTSHP